MSCEVYSSIIKNYYYNMDNNPNAEDPSFLYPQENNNNNGVFMDDYSQIQNDEVPSTIKYVQPSTFTVYTSETIYINN